MKRQEVTGEVAGRSLPTGSAKRMGVTIPSPNVIDLFIQTCVYVFVLRVKGSARFGGCSFKELSLMMRSTKHVPVQCDPYLKHSNLPFFKC